ncbi:autophagy protein 6 [Ptychographa xylographoides]|nr:autophagy protein 6 [Ptychographa xylographoides]
MNCQKCRTPLKLDPSLEDLNPTAFDLLVGSNTPASTIHSSAPSRQLYPKDRNDKLAEASRNAKPALFKRTIPLARQTGESGANLKDNPAMSFVMLTESQLQPSPSLSIRGVDGQSNKPIQPMSLPNTSASDPHQAFSHKIESSTRLFEILSSRSDIDHPICTECTELLLISLQARLSAANKERDAYIQFLKELKNNVPSPAEVAQAEADLAAAHLQEERAYTQLLALEKEKAALADELAELEEESGALDTKEEEFWRSRNALALTLSSLQETRDALNAAYEHDAQQLERLQRTNVYNDTFCIGHDGNFGTINGLRLGRLAPPNNIEWAEINAAWGTTALLLSTVADRLGFAFRGFKIKPMGSTSHIERIEYSNTNSATSFTITPRTSAGRSPTATGMHTQQPKITSLELFSSGDLPLGRTILHRRFNDAMVAFLECLRQLGDYVENGEHSIVRGQQSGGLKLPYKIDKDKIGGLSIKLGISQDEAWTHACKYTLTCCKFLLAHASNVASVSGGSRRTVTH